MKKAILAISLFSLVMILTSFTTSETSTIIDTNIKVNVIGSGSAGGNVKVDVIGSGSAGGNVKVDVIGSGSAGGNVKVDVIGSGSAGGKWIK
jgi:hypothetical protein